MGDLCKAEGGCPQNTALELPAHRRDAGTRTARSSMSRGNAALLFPGSSHHPPAPATLPQDRLGSPRAPPGLPAAAPGLHRAQHCTDREDTERSGRRNLCQAALSLRCFPDLLNCNRYLSSLHNSIPPNYYGINLLAQALLSKL